MSVAGVLVVCCWVAYAGASAPALAQLSRYEVQSTVVVGDAARRGADVGYRLSADLQVILHGSRLHFTLEKPRLLVRGKEADADYEGHSSVWDSHQSSTFEAEWDNGVIARAYLDPTDHTDILNYKIALVSLFQFQTSSGAYNETDISGDCDVLYETLNDGDIRKIKRGCSRDGDTSARRVARYSGGAAVSRLYADELVTVGAPPAAVRARSLHELRLSARTAPPAPPTPAARLAPYDLALVLPRTADEGPALDAALVEYRAALEGDAPGEGGDVAAAAAVSRLLPALLAAPRSALLALLDRDDLLPVSAGLCRALGLAGTGAAAGAARSALRLAAVDAPLAAAAHYLAGLALALRPQPEAVEAALVLAREARAAPVAHAALLAAAAAAPRASERSVDLVRGEISKQIGRCSDDSCVAGRVRALGNLRDARDLSALVEHAERGGPRTATAALAALATAPGLLAPALRRLAALATNESVALDVRAAALDLAVTRGVRRDEVLPLHLAGVASALAAQRGAAAGELRRLLWQRLEALSVRPGVAALVRALPAAARGWAARAAPGSSTALRRAPGWAGGAWSARLDSLQVAEHGALRRGRVALLARGPGGREEPLLAVEVRARGLAALAGTGDADEELGAELALEAGGAALPDVPLFSGQAELLGHVWAGTGAEDTSVVRALVPVAGAGEWVPLGGGAALRGRRAAAVALALDARGSVSLWRRTAQARLALRAGGWARAEAALRVQWAALDASAEWSAAPRLTLDVAVDALEGRVCVRGDSAPHSRREVAAARRELAAARRLSRIRDSVTAVAGRTLSLGRENDESCRTLRFSDE